MFLYSFNPVSFFERLSHHSFLVRVLGKGENLSLGAVFPRKALEGSVFPAIFILTVKMSLWSPGSSGLRGRISSAAPRPGEWIAAGQRMTKPPRTVPFPAGPNPRPGPDLSDSHCLTSGCLGPRGLEKPPGKDRWKE